MPKENVRAKEKRETKKASKPVPRSRSCGGLNSVVWFICQNVSIILSNFYNKFEAAGTTQEESLRMLKM
jgi:hypothetical protein